MVEGRPGICCPGSSSGEAWVAISRMQVEYGSWDMYKEKLVVRIVATGDDIRGNNQVSMGNDE